MKPELAAIAFSVAACGGGIATPSPSAAIAGTYSFADFQRDWFAFARERYGL